MKANAATSIFDLDMDADGYFVPACMKCVKYDFDVDSFMPSAEGGEVDEDDEDEEQEVWYEALEKFEVAGLE